MHRWLRCVIRHVAVRVAGRGQARGRAGERERLKWDPIDPPAFYLGRAPARWNYLVAFMAFYLVELPGTTTW